MKVLPEKRMELSKTIASLSGSIRMEKGCNRCDFCQSIETESPGGPMEATTINTTRSNTF